jgi:dihydrofolate reductase
MSMKIILVFVATLDGKVTKWGNPFVRKWSSPEDQQYFAGLMKSNRLIVMGSNTYNADPIKPIPNRLMVIMTKHPEKYRNDEIPGQLKFSDQSPTELANYFEGEGHQQMLVVGGPHIATSFLKERQIDEIWLTIEPKIFGTGGNFVTEENLDFHLRLLRSETINEQGTLLTKYAVLKNSSEEP